MNMTKSTQNHYNWKSLNNVLTDSPKDVFNTEHINDITTSNELVFSIPQFHRRSKLSARPHNNLLALKLFSRMLASLPTLAS